MTTTTQTKPWKPELHDVSDHNTWRMQWVGEAGAVVYRLSNTRGFMDFTYQARRIEDPRGWQAELCIDFPERFGLVRPCRTWEEFRAVVECFLDHGPHHKHYLDPDADYPEREAFEPAS